MRAVIMDAPGQITVGEREDPRIIEPTDAVIRLTATCICGSDLWPYRGVEPVGHSPMGHEYVGVVEEVGASVTTVKPGDFVAGIGTQSEKARIPHADAAEVGRGKTVAVVGDGAVGLMGVLTL